MNRREQAFVLLAEVGLRPPGRGRPSSSWPTSAFVLLADVGGSQDNRALVTVVDAAGDPIAGALAAAVTDKAPASTASSVSWLP